MSESFITSQGGKFCSEIIKSILSKSENTTFLTGFFCFSEFAEVNQGLNINNFVFFGLKTRQDMLNHIQEVMFSTIE
jgi:hypothetical protein